MKIDSTRTFIAGVIGLPALFAGVFLNMGVAYGATNNYIDEAINALQNDQSYVAPGTDADSVSVYDGTNIGVVVLPGDAFDTLNPANFAQQIYGGVSGEYETVIVVNSDQNSTAPYGVAPTDISEDVFAIIGENNNSPEGAIDGLASDSSELIALTTQAEAPISDSDGPGASILAGGAGVIGGVVVVALVFYGFNRGRRNRVRAVTSKAIRSSELKNSMERFAELTRIHANEKLNSASTMRSILSHLNDLFNRLEKKGVGNAKKLAEVNYREILQKLNDTLGEDYYLDIVKNPRLWDRSIERSREVEKALAAVDSQVLENIRQVNASKDLDFRVALETLLSSVDKPNASDMIR